MNILFLTPNDYIRDELQDYLKDMERNAYFADTLEKAIPLFHAHPIDIVVLDLQRITDFQLLKYIYTYFDNTRIVLMVEENIGNAISIIRNSQFGVLYKPVKLEKLGEIIGQEDDRKESLHKHF